MEPTETGWSFTNDEDNSVKKEEPYVNNFLTFFFATVGIKVENQNKFVKRFWFKYMIFCYVSSIFFQILRFWFVEDAKLIIETLTFIFHTVFLNVATFFIYWNQNDIVDMVEIKDKHFSSYYSKSLVIKNYMTSNEPFKNFLVKYGTTTCVVHFIGYILSPLIHFIFLDDDIENESVMILPSWYPWKIDSTTKYLLTYLLQFVQSITLFVPIIGNFFFIIYFVLEITIQKSNLCSSLGNIVVYAYWESMSNESEVFQMLSSASGGNKSYDDLLCSYLQECIRHHIMINQFIRKFISCYNLVFLGCLAYSVSNLSLICYSLVQISHDPSLTNFIRPMEGITVVLAYILLYCYLGEVITSINNSVRRELYEIKWYEQSLRYQRIMLTFMCLTQRDIVLKAGVTHIASYSLFTSVIRLSYSFFNILSKV